MRKGLITLMTVAIALVSVQAMAYAPILDPIPNPIVGNKSSATQTTRYVYPDAIDLDAFVVDETPDAQLKWSYEVVGTPKYAINGDAPINSASEDPVAPPAAKIINQTRNGMTGANDPNPDNLLNTVSIRNIQLYPYGGTPSTDMSAAAQNWDNNSQAVTFWCSDGNAVSSQTVMFYTDNTYSNNQPIGVNKVSNRMKWTKVAEEYFIGKNWSMYDPFFDKCTSRTWSDGRGICFEVTQTGNNWGSMQSPMGFLKLTANKIYRIRAKMNCTQMSPGKTPLWDFIIENWSNTTQTGLNAYGMDQYYLDNNGGANAVVSTATGTDILMYWAPAAYKNAAWNSTVDGIYSNNPDPPAGSGISYAKSKDAALRFRVMDLDANSTLLNNQKYGAICLQSVIIETIDESQMTYQGNVVNIASGQILQATNTAPGGNIQASSLVGSTLSYTNPSGAFTVSPSEAGKSVDIVTIVPAKDTTSKWYEDWSTITDEWPIPWVSGNVYRYAVTLSAPGTNDAAHPWDVIWMNMEPPTNEVITESWVGANKGFGAPKVAPAQEFVMYYNCGKETWSTIPQFHFLRWRLRFGNNTDLDWPLATDTTNTGSVRLHSVKVDIVKFPER